MSNTKRGRQTPAQRAAAQRRAAGSRPAASTGSGPSASTTLQATAVQPAPQADDDLDVYDLGAVAREAPGERLRFKVSPDRRVWELYTPEEVDWRENSTLTERSVGIEDMRPTLQLLLGEQYTDFLELDISTGQIVALLDQWREWHGITLPE